MDQTADDPATPDDYLNKLDTPTNDDAAAALVPTGKPKPHPQQTVSLPPIKSLLESLSGRTNNELTSAYSGNNVLPQPGGTTPPSPPFSLNLAAIRTPAAEGSTTSYPPDAAKITTSASQGQTSPSPPAATTTPSIPPPLRSQGQQRRISSPPPPLSPFPLTVGNGQNNNVDEQEGLAAAEQAEDGSIVVDSDDVETDAGYESGSNASVSSSMMDSARDYIYENGRRYHRFREGRYNFPNDDIEQQREDMKHAMVKLLCGQLFFAPIGNHPQEILDMGTGTGIWAIEMGDLFESANILGVDLSPIQPNWVPSNVRFMVDDVESPWLHPRDHFDYIHARHTVMAIKNWPQLMRRALEHLRPGGWVEIQDVHHFPISYNNTMAADHPVAQYWGFIKEGLTNLGVDFHAVAGGRLADKMRECGYVNVTERVLHIPIGTWPKNKVLKTVGMYWRCILLDGIQAIALGPLTRGCRWSREQVEVFLVQVRRAYHDNSCLMYMPLHIVYGQKPRG